MTHPIFHPVIHLPKEYPVFDFTRGDRPIEVEKFAFGVGRYQEKRPNVYRSEIYDGIRDIHMGIDLFAPLHTPIHAFAEGRIHLFGYNEAELDYGYTVITEHRFEGFSLYALHGHLSAKSVEGKVAGQIIKRGEVIAWVGDRHENGGWAPHLHFQLSYEKPLKPDMPGVVSEVDLPVALLKYPDPRLVLGPLY